MLGKLYHNQTIANMKKQTNLEYISLVCSYY